MSEINTPKPQTAPENLEASSGRPPAPCSRLESPADVCLNKRSTWVDFDPTKDVIDLADNHHQIQVTVERRAWVCPFCGQSTEYWVVNGSVILGCGMSSMASNGKISDCCDRLECRQKQEKFHGENVSAQATAPDNKQTP